MLRKNHILNMAKLGQERYKDFAKEWLLVSSKMSNWDTIKKLKLKTFSSWMDKRTITSGDKVVKLREER